ncbi:DEAD/DEAH box helicase family protein, partial [Faecalibacterium prausnitzii]
MELYQTQPDRKLRAKALAKEYGIGGHSQDFLDGSSGFVNHDGKGLEFDRYPDHQKFTLSWTQVEKYIDLMIQSDRYLTDQEKEHRAAVQEAERQLPMLEGDAAAEYNALKEQYPNTLIGFELGGYFLFYDKDAFAVKEVLRSNLLSQENALGKVKVTGFLRGEWVAKSQKLWAEGNSIYLAGQSEDGTHHQTKHLRKEDYLPIGSIIKLDGRDFRVDHVNFMFKSVSLQDMDLTNSGQPIFRVERLPHIRELYEQQQDEIVDVPPEKAIDYKVGDEVVVDLPTRTIEGKIGYVGETDVRIDTSAHGQSWDNEVLNKRQFEDGLRRDEPTPDEELNKLPISTEVNGEWQTFPNAAAANEALNAEPVPEAAGNFHITDDNLGIGGPKQKFARNIEAIQTLRTLEQEHRGATAEEQQVLSQYVGWGGLADAFDPNKENWSTEYTQLKGLLTEEEYAAARASTLNAHYTSPIVIRAIYDAVERMGFQSGNILEPSMGVGNFFGMLPDSMADSRLYGVELDSITGRIAQKLYPQADITVAGFETTDRRDFYDLAIGNVPFGQYKVNDKAYNKLGFSIHNYFFAKTIDQIRPGGVIAFVTSHFTMDSKDSSARKYMAERANLLGAIRLPNDAFKANAGTEVVSDIIFLQKRDRPADIEPAWVQPGQTEDGFTLNSYFVEHPEMVLGRLEMESTQYGHDLTVAPIEGASLAKQLAEAVQHIEGQYTAVEIAAPDVADAEAQRKTLPADPAVKNFSYTVVDGEIYYRENSIMTQIELSDNAKGRVAGMVELRQIVSELIDQQLNDFPDEDIKASQEKLNAAYDAFTAKYGLINDKKNARLFDDDSSYYLLCSLENLDENRQLKSKADMFTKRTIRPERVVTSVDTPSEALAVSIGEHGKVDLPYMADLLGTPGDYERITTELSGVIFKDPAADADDPEAGWQTADEYLSGNVRDKLRIAQLAAESHPEFKVNVDALEKAQPKDLEASEIDVRLGATWLDPSIVQQFMMETFQPPYRIRYNNAITVRYSPYTSEWRISNKSATGYGDIMATETYGTRRANAYKILEDTLNLRDSRVYDTIEENGKEKRVLNQNETTLAQQKQQAIKDAFAGWVWKDPQRRALLVKKYNELFNSTRPREYDGSHIHFVGMNPEINLREHQRNAVAHVLYGHNTLLAHEVGAGKSFEMAASAMELKRLGLCQKSLFAVPNHLTEQWASEFLRLYPNAKLLVTSKKDFEPANRKKFCARIATGDYDAVIIGHSQFEKIPLSAERQERLIQEQMDEIEEAIEEAKEQAGEHFTVKQLEKLRKTLKQKLEKLQATDRKDDVVTFEQLGVDRLFVDESQNYKNLFLYTKMRNVAGLSTSEAQKSSDMFGKCRYLDEITGGRGVIFATGTPISNSMTEMYTLMRYLQYNTLQQKGLTHFDAWASTFGETTTAIELAPEGTGYRARTRFAKFFNLPELMAMFKEAADIKTSDQLHLPVPEAKFETVVVKPSEIQQDMVQALSERAAEVHSGSVDPSVDNMLKITSDGRKIGLDQRLMNSALPDDPNSKLNACVNNVLRIWNDTKEQKLTQLIFCDMSTPKGDGSFNVYDDIRTKLLNAGVPEQEIEFIHNADTENKKAELFSKV